ncbi:MAG: VCBS repeat-containing protein [Acidobacteria bacterium]|nr:VCBS repeat-containing protein [Acidobacteriota bacterium]
MERHKWILAVGIIFILSGCGGGDTGSTGNSSRPVPSNPNYEPPTQPPQQSLITRENAVEHLASSLRLVDEHTYHIYEVNQIVFSTFLNHSDEGSYFIEYTCPGDVGVRTLEAQFSETGDSGEIIITNDECGRGHYTTEYNGVIRINVSRTAHPWYPYPTEYTVDFDSYEIYDEIEGTRYIYNGTIAAGPFDDERMVAVSDIIIEENIAGSYIQADDLLIFTKTPTLQYPDVKFLEITGTGVFSDLGTVDITTNTSTMDDLKITGSDNSNILVLFLDEYKFLAKLDGDGDSMPECFLNGYGDGSYEDPGDNDNPLININSTFKMIYDVPVTTSLLNVTDLDHDFLDYSLDIVESPPDSKFYWYIDNNLNLVMYPDVRGDYALDLVANDGKGGTATERIEIQFRGNSPEAGLEQTSFQYNVGDLAEIVLTPSILSQGPFTYSISSPLPGMTISDDGIFQWQIPEFDFFFPSIDLEVKVQVRNLLAGEEIPLAFTITNPNLKHPIVRTGLGNPLTEGNIHVGDFDNDGTTEILLTDNNNLIYTVECEDGGYVLDWVYPYDIDPSYDGIDAILPLDPDDDGHYEIFVQTGLQIAAISMQDNSVTARQDLSQFFEENYIGSVLGMSAADLDNNGSVELAVLLRTEIDSKGAAVVMDAAVLSFLWQTPVLEPNTGMGIGNVDGDGALEIVLSGGYIYDGSTHAAEWEYSAGFGSDIVVADIDGDSVDEIIASRTSGDPPVVYDAVLKTQLFVFPDEIMHPYNMAAADLDGDFEEEIIIGAGSGIISAYDADSGTAVEIWSTQPSDEVVTSLAAGNTDTDGHLEVVWAAGHDLFVFDPVDQAIDFQKINPVHSGPYIGGEILTDGNGDPRIVFGVAETEGGAGSSRLLFMDPETVDVSIGPELGNNETGYFDFCVADYDLNGTEEVLFASAENEEGYLAAYDPNTFTEKLFISGDSSTPRAITCGDANGDGHTDIAAVWDYAIRLYDPYNEALLWSSNSWGSSQSPHGVRLKIHDLDGDAVPEILSVSEYSLRVFTRSGSTYTYESFTFPIRPRIPNILVDDIDGDNKPEIVLSTSSSSGGSSTIYFLNENLDVIEYLYLNESVTALATAGDKDDTLLIATAGDDGSRIKLVDVANRKMFWKSPPLLGEVFKDSLHVIKDPETSKKQLIFGTEDAMYITQ